MHALHQEQGATLRIEIMADQPIRDFIDTHADVLDSSSRDVKMSEEMRQRLSRSNWIFSGIKTFHELNEAFPSLTNEDGSRKPFERFLNDVQSVDETYNRNYLRSEYNFVHASADMAAKWEQFEAAGDRYLLQYRTAQDDRVRPEHAELEGVTLPIDDTFWADYYPPNGWNCRCTVVQVRRGKYEITPHDEAMARGGIALQRDTRGIFRFNSGQQKKSVPDYNPYTISSCKSCPVATGKVNLAFTPTNQLCAACKLVHQCYNHGSEVKQRQKELETSGELNVSAETKEVKSTKMGIMLQSRSVLGRFLDHCRDVVELDAAQYIWKHPDKLQFKKPSPFGEVKTNSKKDKRNLDKKKGRGVTDYNLYTFTYKGKTWKVKTEVHRNGFEQLYSIVK